MIRASPSSAPVCALGHIPPLGEGRLRRGARGPQPALRAAFPVRGEGFAAPRRHKPSGCFAAAEDLLLPPFVILSASEGSRRRRVGFAAAAENSCSRRGQDPSSASPPQDDPLSVPGCVQPGTTSPSVGGKGGASDLSDFSFHYEHIDHISSFCLNFSAPPSLLSFPTSCIITISVHFCALLCEITF